MRMSASVICVAMCCAMASASAHHDQGDVTRGTPVRFAGTVTNVSWDGAHAMYFVDVSDGNGAVTHRTIMASSPKVLRIRGIAKSTVAKGETISVAGYEDPRNHLVSPVYLQLADGRKLFLGLFPNEAEFVRRESMR